MRSQIKHWLFLAIVLSAAVLTNPSMACGDGISHSCSPVPTAENDDDFAREYIAIYVGAWPEWSTGPETIGETKRIPRAVLTVSGKPLYEKILGWLNNAEKFSLPDRQEDEFVSAIFVIEIRDNLGNIRKSFISNGCVFEDDAGVVFRLNSKMQDFLVSLSSLDKVSPACKMLTVQPEKDRDTH